MTYEEILWNAYFETETEETTENQNEEMENELQELYKMTDEEACQFYGVDNKAEAELLIKDYWN